jgi:hypothetical protein
MCAHAFDLKKKKKKKIKKNQFGLYKRIKLKELGKSQKGEKEGGKPK